MVREVVLTMVIAAALAGCAPTEPLTIETIQTGKSLNTDDSIGAISTRFGPNETMYVSVLTQARGSGAITVRWLIRGTLLHEETKDVSYTESAATAFRFQAADAFPAGDFTIEVLVDGEPVGTRTVRVE